MKEADRIFFSIIFIEELRSALKDSNLKAATAKGEVYDRIT